MNRRDNRDNRDGDKPITEIDPKLLKSGKPIFHKGDNRGTYEVVDWSIAQSDGLCRSIKVRRVDKCAYPGGWYRLDELSLRDMRVYEEVDDEDEE